MASLSFVIPARNRPDELARTLETLAAREASAGEETIVIDNASSPPLDPPTRLANGTPLTLIRRDDNLGAAARNLGVDAARGDWIVMLDDDSAPIDAADTANLARTCDAQTDDVAAFGGEIHLPTAAREAGGLPEVIIGCGCAIRRDAFRQAGGYDPAFDYYAEEYDLCARLIALGYRITHTRAVRFLHRKSTAQRSMDRILGRLVRNNAWTIRRYAPRDLRDDLIASTIDRYRRIAHKENATAGFDRGLAELEETLNAQPDRELSRAHWDRFTGIAAIRDTLIPSLTTAGVTAARITHPGKGVELIERALRDANIAIDPDAPTAVIGTLSPGPMLDARDADPHALPAWTLDNDPGPGESLPSPTQ